MDRAIASRAQALQLVDQLIKVAFLEYMGDKVDVEHLSDHLHQFMFNDERFLQM